MKDPVTLYLFLFLSGQAATEMGIKGLTINMSGNMRWFCLYSFIFYSTRPTRLGLHTRPMLDCKSSESQDLLVNIFNVGQDGKISYTVK